MSKIFFKKAGITENNSAKYKAYILIYLEYIILAQKKLVKKCNVF